jgi:hypothetical protein
MPEEAQTSPSKRIGAGPKKVLLPFSVRIVRTDDQLEKAISIRSEAYAKHIPLLGEALKAAEASDRSSDTIVFVAESYSSGEPLGTIRIHTNFSNPIPIESSIELPEGFKGKAIAGVSRLAVKSGSKGRLVKIALFKALHRFCLAKQIEWLVIGARPPLDRGYLELGFTDVFPDTRPRPLVSAGGVPHRILCFEVFTAERRWFDLSHPLYVFMGKRYHPDIEIFSSVNNMWAQPRSPRPVPSSDYSRLEIPLV